MTTLNKDFILRTLPVHLQGVACSRWRGGGGGGGGGVKRSITLRKVEALSQTERRVTTEHALFWLTNRLYIDLRGCVAEVKIKHKQNKKVNKQTNKLINHATNKQTSKLLPRVYMHTFFFKPRWKPWARRGEGLLKRHYFGLQVDCINIYIRGCVVEI